MRPCDISCNLNLRDTTVICRPVIVLSYEARSSMPSDVLSICYCGAYGSSPRSKNGVNMRGTSVPTIVLMGVELTHAVSESINPILKFCQTYIGKSGNIQVAMKNVQKVTKAVVDERNGGQVFISFRTIIKNPLRRMILN